MDKKLVIIPTYNEKENIRDILTYVLHLPGDFHILVIDDGSPDGTATIVKELAAEAAERIHLIERSGKLGLGTAYLTGFKWALEHGYDYIFEMDADFSHNPDDLLRLYAACQEGADVAIGSRYCNGVSVVDWPIGRIIMSYISYASKVMLKSLQAGLQPKGSPHRIHQPAERDVQDERRYFQRSPLGRDRPPVQAFLSSRKLILFLSRSTERTWTLICSWSLSTLDGTAIPF